MGRDVGVASIGSGSDQVEGMVDVFHRERLSVSGIARSAHPHATGARQGWMVGIAPVRRAR
ncbi:hypothetical protein [Streptomyces sp. NPDC001401]|uniref:hypothetical protein n=1 Tax=Streptomyces sp. NPDC001401 TaxID=3364570 RepID=UPI0036AA725E